MDSSGTWYYLDDSRQIGPYTRDELEALLDRGAISTETLVWTKHRCWAPMGGTELLPQAAPKQRRTWIILLAATWFWGGLSYEAESPVLKVPSSAAMLVSPQISYEKNQSLEVAALPPREQPPRYPSTGGQFVQEYWRAISHSKVIGRYEYYLRRSPSGSFAAAAAERIKELSSETPEQPKVELKKEKTPARQSRPKKARPDPTPPEITKKSEARCWSRSLDVCRERCRSGEKLACEKLMRLGG
jgi:uncharacterized protein DUF4339